MFTRTFSIFPLLILATLGMSAWGLPRGTVQPLVATHYLGWDGRALGVTDAGAVAGVTGRLTAGAVGRTVSGHGRTTANRYTAAGWEAWAEWNTIPSGKAPGITLRLESTGESIHLATADATSSFAADPTYAAHGVQVRMTKGRWHAGAGLAAARLNGDPLTAVASVGAGLDLPLGRDLRLQPEVTGYADEYQGRHLATGVCLALRTAPARRADLTLEASLFPQGVPLAGTPLSAASAVGAVYGDANAPQLRTRPVAYVSLSGGYQF
jgi:hypothetical protein